MAQVHNINSKKTRRQEGHEEYMKRRLKEEQIKERTPDQWDDVIAELKSRIKKLEEDMAYAMAKK